MRVLICLCTTVQLKLWRNLMSLGTIDNMQNVSFLFLGKLLNTTERCILYNEFKIFDLKHGNGFLSTLIL